MLLHERRDTTRLAPQWARNVVYASTLVGGAVDVATGRRATFSAALPPHIGQKSDLMRQGASGNVIANTGSTVAPAKKTIIWRQLRTGQGGLQIGRVFDKGIAEFINYDVDYDAMSYTHPFSLGMKHATWAAPLNELQGCALSYDSTDLGADPRVFINGSRVTVTSQLTPTGTPTYTADPVIIGARANGTREWEGLLGDFAILDCIVPDADLALFSIDPQRIYQTQRRSWMVDVAAAPSLRGTLGQFHPELRIAAWF